MHPFFLGLGLASVALLFLGRRALFAAGLAFVFAPLVAFAQEAGGGLPPVPVMQPKTPLEYGIYLLLVVAMPFLLKLFRDWQKDNADRRLGLIDHAIQLAFWATEEAKRMGVNVPSAVLFAESKFLEILRAQNVEPKPGELSRARLSWSALHGQEKAAAGATADAGKVAGETLAAHVAGNP